jgi:hypothetical protein
VRFDGGLVDTKPLGDLVSFTAYGGIPTNLYEASHTGDWLVGGAAELPNLPRSTVRLDYIHITDARPDIATDLVTLPWSSSTVRNDDLFSLTSTVRLTPDVRLYVRGAEFLEKATLLNGSVLWQPAGADFSVQARYNGQFGNYHDMTFQFSPFEEQLGPYNPFQELEADLRKGINENLAITAGAQDRWMVHANDTNAANNGFVRLFGGFDVREWPWEGLGFNARGDWFRRPNGSWTFEASADVSQIVGPVTLSAGTGYYLYRFQVENFFLVQQDDVRTVYGGIDWKILPSVRLRLNYSYERDDFESYNVVRCNVRFSF